MSFRVVDGPDPDRLEALLDAALDQSFPASDPIAVNVEWSHPTVAAMPTSGGIQRHV
ncbi:hypothetical protein [Oceaniglobus indicus]|uniref:hypothetical protein n=1 Tax=Oceaniglobus indicus TaxID=2047749 RepID=UPI0013040ED5|nr:hypothetical protein [Oceaniglobus indicus]